MTITEMLGQSGILSVLGMAVVFIFLWIMIVGVNLTAKVIHKLELDKDVTESKPSVPVSSGGASQAVTAAITAAVNEYQKNGDLG